MILKTHRYVLRAVIEFVTPFLIGAGREGEISDSIFVSDANRLPVLPGSSIAGAVRSAFRAAYGQEEERRLFGFQEKQDGAGAMVSVSWGCILDSKGSPVEGIADAERLQDPVLLNARRPLIRDHVRINHRGASDAAEHGKFDEQAVSAGHRFIFEIELTGTEEDDASWDKLQRLLAEPSIRFGGKTRRGFGDFRFVQVMSRCFDLRREFDEYKKHPVSLAEPSGVLKRVEIERETSRKILLTVKPLGYWMFGGGYDIKADGKEADMAPFRDSRIVWTESGGKVSDSIAVIPATAIKGAIAHRVAFHYNALKAVFADQLDVDELKNNCGENNLAVRELFGYCAGEDNEQGKESGHRGRVLLDDIFLTDEPSSQLVHHVGIDRFTGGARDSVLFSERPFWKGESIALSLAITDIQGIKDAPHVLEALRLSLCDLAEGRLQIGAGSGRGLGYFQAEEKFHWPEGLSAITEGTACQI